MSRDLRCSNSTREKSFEIFRISDSVNENWEASKMNSKSDSPMNRKNMSKPNSRIDALSVRPKICNPFECLDNLNIRNTRTKRITRNIAKDIAWFVDLSCGEILDRRGKM